MVENQFHVQKRILMSKCKKDSFMQLKRSVQQEKDMLNKRVIVHII
jgi:hypothetical protein